MNCEKEYKLLAKSIISDGSHMILDKESIFGLGGIRQWENSCALQLVGCYLVHVWQVKTELYCSLFTVLWPFYYFSGPSLYRLLLILLDLVHHAFQEH